MKLKDDVLKGIASTTREASPFEPGTIIAKKKGDWIYWILGVAILLGMVYAPALLRAYFA